MLSGYAESKVSTEKEEKVFHYLINQINKCITNIGEAEIRLQKVTHRLFNPQPQPAPSQLTEVPESDTLEGKLREIAVQLERKSNNLQAIAIELERGF